MSPFDRVHTTSYSTLIEIDIAPHLSKFANFNPPDLNPLDYHVRGAMFERYKTFQPKPNTIDELKNVLQTIWDDLPQNVHQQDHTELCKKTSSLCESLGRTL